VFKRDFVVLLFCILNDNITVHYKDLTIKAVVKSAEIQCRHAANAQSATILSASAAALLLLLQAAESRTVNKAAVTVHFISSQ
jgi:hypothetical protein